MNLKKIMDSYCTFEMVTCKKVKNCGLKKYGVVV